MSTITTERLREMIDLKRSDREMFLKRLEEMAQGSADILLSYRKFKEYPANV